MGAFSGKVGTGFPQKMRPNKESERFPIQANRKALEGKAAALTRRAGRGLCARPEGRYRRPLLGNPSRSSAFTMDADAYKRQAAAGALDFVRAGMRIGLGTGSTAAHFVELLAERVRGGLDVVGVPTSEATRVQAARLGVPLTTLDETPELDLTVDGADEIAPDLSLIKGGGGAL